MSLNVTNIFYEPIKVIYYKLKIMCHQRFIVTETNKYSWSRKNYKIKNNQIEAIGNKQKRRSNCVPW